MTFKYKVGVATVFYNPDTTSIYLYKSLADYGYVVAIANNGMSGSDLKLIDNHKNIIILGSGLNVGLARAMNDAIAAVIKFSPEIDSVILFDQDSKPEYSLPNALRESYFLGCDTNSVACIGPLLHDEKSSLILKEKLVRYSDVQTIATSGTLIPRDKYEKVGPLKEEFFIDCLDHEWCFRARDKGMRIIIDNSIVMKHNMGEEGIDWFGSYKPIYRSPIRHYYITRNTLTMLRIKYVPIGWRVKEFLKLIRRIVFYIIFSNNRMQTVRSIFKAMIDSIFGRLGARN